jgi:hypothetical protein
MLKKMFPELYSLFNSKKAIHLPAKHSFFMEEEVFPLKDTTKNIPPNGMLLILCHVYAQVSHWNKHCYSELSLSISAVNF